MTVPHVLYQGQPGPESLAWNASIDPAPRYWAIEEKMLSKWWELSSPPFQALSCPVNGFKIFAAHPFHPLCKNQQIIPNIPTNQTFALSSRRTAARKPSGNLRNCRNCHFENTQHGESHKQVTNSKISKFLSRKSVPLAKVHFRKCYISEKNLGCSSFEIRQCVEKLKNFGLSPCSQRRWLSVHCNLVRNCSATHPLLMQVNLSGHKSGAKQLTRRD